MFVGLFAALGGLSLVSVAQAQQGAWGQCGGNGWGGQTTCVSGYYCSVLNPWYSQCIPGTPTSSSSSTKSTSTSSSTKSTSTSVSVTATVNTSTSLTPSSTTSSPTPTNTSSQSSFVILVGGYGNSVVSLKFNPSASTLTYMTQTSVAQMTTWLSTHPANSSIVYAAQEAWYTNGNIFSLILDPATGSLTTKNSVSTGPTVSNYGGGCVHVIPIKGGTALAAANFNSGSAFVVPLNSDRISFGTGQVLQFTGSGPLQNQKSAHAHEAIEYGDEVIVADLGSDLVRRLAKNGNTWYEAATIKFPAGSGPRHMVAMDNILYTLHQNYNALSQSTLPALGSGGTSQVVANFTIVPPDTTSSSGMSAAELLWAPSVTSGASPLLYASNRDDPSKSDAIAIFETTPALKPVAYVRTGLQHVRGMEFVGPNKEYIVAGGMNGGGIKVFKRVSAAQGYLTQVAAFNSGQIVQPTGFTWVSV